MKVGWSSKSLRAFKSLVRKNRQLRILIEQTLRQLAENPFHPSLRTHRLKGDLADFGHDQSIIITGFFASLS